MQQKIKKYQLWYKVFLTVGLFGLVDIVVGVLLKNAGTGFGQDGGGLTFMIIYAFKYLFKSRIEIMENGPSSPQDIFRGFLF